jgi:hypothetical protein
MWNSHEISGSTLQHSLSFGTECSQCYKNIPGLIFISINKILKGPKYKYPKVPKYRSSNKPENPCKSEVPKTKQT